MQHRRKLGKILGGLESEHLGYTPRIAKGRVGVGMEGDWIRVEQTDCARVLSGA